MQREENARDERLAEATNSETLSDVRAETKLNDKDSTAREVGTTLTPDGDSTLPRTSDKRAGGSSTDGDPM